MFNRAIVVRKHINKLSFDLKPMSSRWVLAVRSILPLQRKDFRYIAHKLKLGQEVSTSKGYCRLEFIIQAYPDRTVKSPSLSFFL